MADDRKTRKPPGPVSLVDMERQFQDDDALARAINSALMDADLALSRAREKTPPSADEGEIAFVTEEMEAADAAASSPELDLPVESEPPPAPVPPPRRPSPPAQGLAPVEEAPEPRHEAPDRVRSGAASQAESDTYERLLRVMAEFENYKKRMVREQEDFKRFALEKLLLTFLPVMDNMERAISHSETAENMQVLLDGVKMIQRQMRDVMLKAGVRGFDSAGQRFDPTKHQAMQTRPAPDAEPGTVLEEFQRGYFLHDRLIRPALVVVAERHSQAAVTTELPGLGDAPLQDGGEEIIEDLEPIEELEPVQDGELGDIEELQPVEEAEDVEPR